MADRKFALFYWSGDHKVHAAALPLEDTFEPLTPPRMRALCDGVLRVRESADLSGVTEMPTKRWREDVPYCEACAARMSDTNPQATQRGS